MNTEREEIDSVVNYDLDWHYETEISKIRKDLDELELLGATHIKIDHGVSYNDSSFVTFEAVERRLETELEVEVRNNNIRKREEEIRRRDLLELERIKLKYNK